MHLSRLPVLFLGLLLCGTPVFAAVGDQPASSATNPAATSESATGELLPGHSAHGEAFNEGPRQAAVLMQGMGSTVFPVTTTNGDAQKFMNQGVAQLHGFWYFEAERSFRQAAALDSNCGMAYWGMAMANTNNEKRAKGFIAEAVKRKDKLSERERLYIEALDGYYKADAGKKRERAEAYVKALEKVIYAAPDDINAKAFLALQIWTNRDAGIPVGSYVAADSLLDSVFRVDPLHPAQHYRIHLWDSERPQNALAAAAMCGQTTPGIAHMWHMSGHIFSDLKRYSDAAWQQEASARVDHAHMQQAHILPDQIHNFAHNNEWLIRDLNFLGRAHDAASLARNMIELPQHPKYNTQAKQGSANYGRQRLFDTLARFELWDELIAATNDGYLPPTDSDNEQVKRLRFLGQANFRKGDVAAGKQILDEVKQRFAKVADAMDRAVADAQAKPRAEMKPQPELDKIAKEASKPFKGKQNDLEKAAKELEGHLAVSEGNVKDGLAKLREAGGVEAVYLNRLQFQLGEKDAAEKAARDLVGSGANQVLPLAALVDLLWQNGKKDEATKKFEELRKLAGAGDLDTPPLARLAPIAKELTWPDDWRTPQPPAADVGTRPALDTLGPFRWQPYAAAEWTLPAAAGAPRSLESYRGKPVVVIFFLGSGCLHCVEQLQAFGPKAEEFKGAGIDLVAISMDEQDGLKKSLANYKPGVLPIPLLADPQLTAFKAYGCYDDFEQKTLHGTFFIDPTGRVRWQDIAYEPFMDATFVLKEAKRLLAQTAPAANTPAAPSTATAPLSAK